MAKKKTKVRRPHVGEQSGFRVAARTLLHLGRELITSDEIALNELIKNSYDAGSKIVEILICCPVAKQQVDDLLDQVGTLTPSRFASKRVEIANVLLAAARSGLQANATDHLKEICKKLASAENVLTATNLLEQVNFIEVKDSGSGIKREHILPVFLTVGTDFKAKSAPPKNVDEYLGNKGIGRLAMMRLGDRADVLTWADQVDAAFVSFDWRAFDRTDKELSQIEISVKRRKAQVSSQSGTQIRLYALRRDWIPGDSLDIELKAFFRRLRDPFVNKKGFAVRVSVNGAPSIPFKPMDSEVRDAADQQLTIEFNPSAPIGEELTITTVRVGTGVTDVEKQSLQVVATTCKANAEQLKRIGPFTMRLMRFNRTHLRSKKKGEWKAVQKELDTWVGGIAIYRDGFRVGFTGSDRGEDWLGLDSKALRGSGYSLNRIQVVGALEITHRGNPRLVDLTNREGLIGTLEAEHLKQILLAFAIAPLRGVIEAQDEQLKKERFEALINEGVPTLNRRVDMAKEEVSRLAVNVPQPFREPVKSIERHLHFISTQVQTFEAAIEKAREGREDIMELAGVGNVMHGVLHELTRATAQTRRLIGEWAKDADQATQELLDKLEAEIRAINVRLRQLDPLMPSGRQVKKDIEVDKLVKTILDGYTYRFRRHNIVAEVSVVGKVPVRVRMVPGFLSLVLENLVSNSVYWLIASPPPDGPGMISIEIDEKSGVLHYSDNGPGIAVSDRDRAFSPGWSLKPDGKGYGLYLAREVAEFHGCKMFLENISDSDGRVRTFVLELPRGRA